MTTIANERKKRGAMVIILISMLFSLLVSMQLSLLKVHADRSDVDAVITLDSGLSDVSSICTQANHIVGLNILVYTGDNGVLTFSNKEYSNLEIEQKQDFMKTALQATKESSLGTQMKNKVYNFIANQDNPTSAAVKYLQSDASVDFVSAKAWFRPFSGIFGTIMGVICLITFVFLAMSIIFDVAYLVLPGFQALLEHGEEHKRPFGVSREAWKANNESEKINEAQSVMSIYIKKRLPVIILISLCLGYVISGKVYDLIIFFIDAFSNPGTGV